MQIVNTKPGYNFKMTGNKTFAVLEGDDSVAYCPFCYSTISFDDDKCPVCKSNIPEIIYYHGDDDTWIASGNE